MVYSTSDIATKPNSYPNEHNKKCNAVQYIIIFIKKNTQKQQTVQTCKVTLQHTID